MVDRSYVLQLRFVNRLQLLKVLLSTKGTLVLSENIVKPSIY